MKRIIALFLTLLMIMSGMIIPTMAEEALPEVSAAAATPTDLQPAEEPAQPAEEPIQPAEEPAQPAEEPAQPEVPAQPEPAAEAPAPQPEEAKFTEGYVLLKKGVQICGEMNPKAQDGEIKKDSYAWATVEDEAPDPAQTWLSVVFDTEEARKKGEDPVRGYVTAGQVQVLTEAEATELEAQLEKDKKAREYKGHKLPVATYFKVIIVDPDAVAQDPDPELSCTPAVLKIKIGETARFYTTVKNAVTEIAYQWQSSADEGQTWTDLEGQKESMLAFEVTKENKDNLFRCAVWVNSLHLTAPVVRLNVESEEGGEVTDNTVVSNGKPKISISPKIWRTNVGSQVQFTATVKNPRGEVQYQWQYSKNGGKSWKNAKYPGYNTAVMTVEVTSSIAKKYQFRCVAKTGGKKLTSKTAQIFAVKGSASTQSASIGQQVKFSVSAYNYGKKGTKYPKYQWQVSTDGGQNWQKLPVWGYDTKKITVLMTEETINWLYRCRVKGKNGTCYTDPISVNGGIQPEPEPPQPEPPQPSGGRRLAVVVANSNYQRLNYLPGVYKDGTAVSGALNALGWDVMLVRDATVSQMDNAIRSHFSGSTADDVCLFYYSGHGSEDTGSTAGALCGIDYAGSASGLYFPYQLRDTLLASTSGRVVIALDSCGSGAGVYANGAGARSFTNAVINAFKGYLITKNGAKTGELLNNRFAVLAACAYGTTSQDGYVYEGKGPNGNLCCRFERGGTFTYSMLRSMGRTYPDGGSGGSMNDSNGDGKLSLGEAYNGIKSQVSYMNQLLKKYDYLVWLYADGVWQYGYLDDGIAQEVQMGGDPSAIILP